MSLHLAKKTVLFILGWVCVVLGFIGALLPVMPTTPFLLLAAYFFSQSSPKFHKWLLDLPVFGPLIIDWEKNRVIRPQAKVMSVVTIIAIFSSSIYFANLQLGLNIMLVCIALACIAFILTRKSRA